MERTNRIGRTCLRAVLGERMKSEHFRERWENSLEAGRAIPDGALNMDQCT